jgi:hypothetical protein
MEPKGQGDSVGVFGIMVCVLFGFARVGALAPLTMALDWILKAASFSSCMQIRSGYGHQDAIGESRACLPDSRRNFLVVRRQRIRKDIVLGAGVGESLAPSDAISPNVMRREQDMDMDHGFPER